MRFTASNQPAPVFPTYGVHNPPEYSPCAAPDCLYTRAPGEPSDPTLPLFWSARWTMYRVFNKYAEFPPPYDGPPPAELKESKDYHVSHGVGFYDSTWRGPNGVHGAVMEHYIDWSLPIFPFDNHYTCSFISLGDNAYILTYDKDRPEEMPPVCLFSDLNHPPRRDFIKHLPYSRADSDRLGGRVQGFSFWASPNPQEPPIQTGSSPDRTADRAVSFGYAFHSRWEPDTADETAAPYRHPHSFYFSGLPSDPPNAPIVSQYLTGFAIIKPDPVETWNLAEKVAAGEPISTCNLFGTWRTRAGPSRYGPARHSEQRIERWREPCP
jgi:hypothetical protein